MFVLIKRMECRTGDAEKFKCRKCGAEHWRQLTVGSGMNFRPLRETTARLAQAVAAGPVQTAFY